MTRRMLIDAGHREETRVVVTDGRELQEFDVESSVKSQLKGNIYLAKVTRVEPSLQAAFIEYGGNRHGFLAFSEIHPDYFQIPVSDREALAAEQARLVERAQKEAEEEDEPEDDNGGDATVTPDGGAENEDGDDHGSDDNGDDNGEGDNGEASAEAESEGGGRRRRGRGRRRKNEDAEERQEAARHAAILKRGYKIQEVIKRRQILLIQVVKEERGNKGAALTTYLSIAGRYCVLMPNTPRGGGISRKIADSAQRRRLKEVAHELEVPEGMGLIIRTAGQGRTKAEIKRDFASLLKQWEEIREATLKASAPALIYEEANIIKRAIRDLYSKEIDEIFVEGEDGYKMARAYMKLLMPSHASRVQLYKEPTPLFLRHDVERQLDAMHSPVVQLKSGGYIVINPTEALVAIDVNSGRSTKERNIEETASKTNLEAADEIARQLRLRDLAGLIVIDFIDMEEHRNERNVERRLKEAVKVDRARIQLGRISTFGLLELSRQRLRPSLTEALSETCPLCGGTGHVRSTESTSLHVLRGIENEGLKGRASAIRVYVPTTVALFLLNQKRQSLLEIEARYDFTAIIERDDSLVAPDFRVEVITARSRDEEREEPAAEAVAPAREEAPREARREPVREAPRDGEDGEEEDGGRKRRRRRRRRKGRGEGEDGRAEDSRGERQAPSSAEAGDDMDEDEDEERDGEAAADGAPRPQDDEDGGSGRKRRRRGRRGGRRRRGRPEDETAAGETAAAAPAEEEGESRPEPRAESRPEPRPENRRSRPAPPWAADDDIPDTTPREDDPRPTAKRRRDPLSEVEDDIDLAGPAPEPAPRRVEPVRAPEPKAEEPRHDAPAPEEARPQEPAAQAPQPAVAAQPELEPEAEPEKPAGPPRRGWWNKIVGS